MLSRQNYKWICEWWLIITMGMEFKKKKLISIFFFVESVDAMEHLESLRSFASGDVTVHKDTMYFWMNPCRTMVFKQKSKEFPSFANIGTHTETDALPIYQKEINFVISIYIKILRFVFLLQDLKNCWLILIAVFN